jgi:hypothetical protein
MGCKRRMEVIGRIGDVQHTPKYNNETYTKDDALGMSASGPISDARFRLGPGTARADFPIEGKQPLLAHGHRRPRRR